MISSCLEARNSDLAEHIVRWARGQQRCTVPVFSAAIKVLAAAKQPEKICDLYESVVDEGLEPGDALHGQQLIKFAVQAGRYDLARQLFGRARNPDARNYMSLMRACGQEGNVPRALEMLWDLCARGEADTAAYNAALDVCVTCGDSAATLTVLERATCRRRWRCFGTFVRVGRRTQQPTTPRSMFVSRVVTLRPR